MKNHIGVFTLSLFLLLLSACQKEESLSPLKRLTSFAILQKDNPGKIGKDIRASVGESTVSLSIPKYEDLKSLVATFEYEGEKITVGGVAQQSGVTANDYSKPLTFTLTAQNGTTASYTVKVSPQEKPALSAFGFQKKENPDMPNDIACTLSDQKITSTYLFPVKRLIPTFTADALKVSVEGEEQVSGVTAQDFSKAVTYRLTMRNGEELDYVVELEFVLPDIVTKVSIVTDDPTITEIPSKDYYLKGTVTIDGKGIYDNFTGKTEIKGRGNSTWSYPKKPYRLKLDKKSELCGLGKAKNYVLLANYLDPTLMLNSVAFKIGHLLGLPFTNHAIPVDVYLNERYKGSYLLTEQVEINESRVNIPEETGVVWELDSYWDEDPKFKTTAFNLPVMLKDPDMDDARFNASKAAFNAFTEQFAKEPVAGNSYVDLIDIESVANFLIVFNLTQNMEINHPKSVYLHHSGTGKYVMGPLWDFDWAYGYEGGSQHFTNVNRPLFDKNMSGGLGQTFFERFLSDSRVRALYKKNWTSFRANGFQQLIQYIDDYVKVLKPSAERDSKVWTNTRNFELKVSELKAWLKGRATYIDTQVSAY